ncbi:winged helix-turn-helix domain-containing protein [Candidatus Woesearchaeota archaeon]|nr:winged helix-turn-helix domain-containing protein [Candidatus Woesearchaeota archaeon]
MGQRDIIDLLRKSPGRWLNAQEIAHKLNVSAGSVLACLRRLRKSGLVEFQNQMQKVGTVYKKVFIYRFKGPK